MSEGFFDPFRVQVLAVSVDSEVVLALLGVVVAGLVARSGARRAGLDPRLAWDLTLDGAFWVLVGARVGWVVAHLDYYARALLAVLALGDGGYLHGAGALAGAAFLVRARRAAGIAPAAFAAMAAPAVAAAQVLDRAGCALTGCGTGRPADVPWALVRSGSAVHPVGLYAALLWLVALLLLRATALGQRAVPAWATVLATLTVDRLVAWGLGHEGADGLVVAAALLVGLGVLARFPPSRWPTGVAGARGATT